MTFDLLCRGHRRETRQPQQGPPLPVHWVTSTAHSLPPSSPSLTHSLTVSPLTHSLSHCLSLTHSLSHCLPSHSLTLSLSFPHSLTLSLAASLSFTHSRPVSPLHEFTHYLLFPSVAMPVLSVTWPYSPTVSVATPAPTTTCALDALGSKRTASEQQILSQTSPLILPPSQSPS